MDASSQFASVSITKTRDFSWVFFADWFLTYFLAIGIIFYFSRFVGLLISYILRILLWKTKKIKIDVQAIKLSFLGGRLFFKNLTMIDRDQTICASQGSITWRYWIPTVRKTELTAQTASGDGIEGNMGLNSKLPCRISIEVDGLEVFIYNRTVSYENIMEQLSKQKSNTNGKNNDEKDHSDVFSNSVSEDTIRSDETEWTKPSSLLGKILPIQIKVNKGAIIAGNKSTQAILVLSYASSDGVFDLLKADNPLDDCRHSFHFNFERLQVSLKPNVSYQGEKNETSGLFFKEKPSKKRYANRWILYRSLLNLWKFAGKKRSKGDQHSEWRGLAQYIDTDSDSIANVLEREHEYGKYTHIVDSDFCRVQYYYDIPGPVRENAPSTNPLDGLDIGNGGSAPKFGMNIQLSNSTIFYGPWAERQRHSLHQMLFPTLCRDGQPQEKLQPGKHRVITQYNLFVEIMDEAIIRVPIREFSKNEEYAEANKNTPDTKRPFGWLELKIDKNSTITTDVAMVGSNTGYENKMSLALQNLEVRSSVNHDIMMRCKEHLISADIGYPLKWNGHTTWTFLNESKNVDTFLLREHITLLSDMFTDFASGPATPYELFRPFTYAIDWKVSKYAIYMNVNDANIINNPLDFNDNIYLSFQGDFLDINLQIPLEAVLRKANTISFNLSTPQLSMILDTPPWHTLNNFLENKEVGRSQDFRIDGSYTYHSEVGLDLVDTIIIACKGKHMVLECYGFVVKYILSIKENYFGDFTRFKTLEEYTQLFNQENKGAGKDEESVASNQDDKNDKKKVFKRTENEEDVHFSFDVEEGCLVLPSNIYNCASNMSLFFSTLNMDLRFTNYYMDFQADITPVKGIYVDKCDPRSVLDIRDYVTLPRHDLFVDGLAIHGHRMFGLPPDELKYFCKWDLEPGEVEFSGKAEALEGLISSLVKLGFGYKNLENNLLIDEPEIHDTTSVSLSLSRASIKIDDPEIASIALLELSKINFTFVDITNPRYTERVSAVIENILFNVQERNTEKIEFELQTSLIFTDFGQVKDFAGQRAKHDNHTVEHDGPFHRIPFFLNEDMRNIEYNNAYGSIVPSYSLPDGAPPITAETIDLIFEDIGLDPEPLSDESSTSTSGSTSTDKMDFFQDFNSDYLPSPGAQRSKNTRKKDYFRTVTGSSINPTGSYRDEDFCPSYNPDPRYKYDNLILNFGDIDVSATPMAVFSLLLLGEKFLTRSMTAVLDDLHIAVLKKLFVLRNKEPSVTNIRFIAPKVNFNFGEFAWESQSEPTLDSDHVGIMLTNPSLTCSFIDTVDNNKETTISLNVSSLIAGLYASKAVISSLCPLKLVVEDLEFWSDKRNKKIESVSLRKFDLELQAESVVWLKSYIEKLLYTVSKILDEASRIKFDVNKSEIELLYQITLASTIFSVEHDPAVITRPAYIIRLSRQHIRANDSWKVITRLRHIYENLPTSWKEEHQRLFLGKRFEAPEDAMKDVVDIFSRWRSWEFEDIECTYIFRYVFSQVLPKTPIDSVHGYSVEEGLINLATQHGDDNFVSLNFLEVSGTKSFLESLSRGEYDYSSSTSVRLSLFKGEISPLIQTLKEFKDINFKRKENENMVAQNSSQELHQDVMISKKVNQIVLTVDNYHFSLDIFKIGADLSGSDLGFTLLNVTERGDQDITSAFSSKQFSTEIRSENVPSMIYSVSHFGFNFSSAEDFKFGPKLLDVSAKSAKFIMDQNTAHYDLFLENLKDDIDKIKVIIGPKKSKTDKEATEYAPKLLLRQLKAATVRFSIQEFKWKISVLDPLSLTGSIEKYQTMFSFAKMKALNTVGLSSFILHLKSDGYDLFELTCLNLDLLSRATVEPITIGELLIKSGSISLFIPDVLDRLKQVQDTMSNVKDSISMLKARAKTLQRDKPFEERKNTEKIPSSSNFEFLKKITFISDHFSFGIKLKHTTFGVDFNQVSCSYHDFEVSSDAPVKVKPFGDLGVDSTKLIVRDTGIRPHLSTVFDLNLGLKVVNTIQENLMLQTLQIESTYCRLMLHPRTIVKLLEFVNDISYLSSLFQLSPSTSKSKEEGPKKIQFVSYFHSIHMLFYNFCVGFMFEEPSDEYAGVIAGCEKVFVISEESYGKLSLINAYFSIANGKSSVDFYSAVNELNSPNRAFLPNMQVMYAIKRVDNKKDIMIRVTGEELDVKFVSSSIVLLEQTLKSVGTIETLKKRIRVYPTKRSSTTLSQDSYKLPSDVTSIGCVMNFAGGIIKLYRTDDFELLEDIYSPSFELRTPAVKIGAEYTKTSGLKDHHVNLEVFTSSSNNTLYSTCVPVIFDIWRSVKNLGHESRYAAAYDTRRGTEGNSTIKDTDFLKILTNFHVSLAIHIDKQELSLSCEPSAKVQAVVGIEGISIRLGTNDEDDTQPLSGVLTMGKLGASLQHIYSREVSGSVEVEELVITLLLGGPEKMKVYAAGKVENVSSYINLKQLQDLDLFKDLWFPKDVHPRSSNSSIRSSTKLTNQVEDENLVLRFQKVSTSSALPWNFDFMILNVNCEVDLGQSLGILTLKLDRFWAASRKQTNWEQNMLIGFDTISFLSEGRLSGHLIIKDIRLRSVIQWSLISDSFDIPLVLLSFGLKSIEAKASFDYNVFIIARVLNAYITVYNQVDREKVLQDKLVASTVCESVEVFTTALAASNILDIYNTISRIRQDNKRSYREDLKTSAPGAGDYKKSMDIMNVIATLRTELELNFGKLLVQIYPGSLLDAQVLVIDVGGLTAHFEQKLDGGTIATDLQLNLHNTCVALSSFRRQLPEEVLTEMSIDDYVLHATTARGGGIFVFPSLGCSMQTWQVPKQNTIKYRFKSAFGGKVDVRWNLGSVNFIREMWATHARAFSSRLQKPENFEKTEVPLYENVNIEEKIKDVELEGKYIYTAVEPPIIEAPQLRDLGDATPPLEWFGLHRQRFPGITHQFVIVGLQKLVHEVEQQYGRVLGKA